MYLQKTQQIIVQHLPHITEYSKFIKKSQHVIISINKTTVVYISHSLLITATFPPVFLLNQNPLCYFITPYTKHAVSLCCLLIMSKQNSNFQCVNVFCKTKQNYWKLSTLMQLFHIKVYHTLNS